MKPKQLLLSSTNNIIGPLPPCGGGLGWGGNSPMRLKGIKYYQHFLGDLIALIAGILLVFAFAPYKIALLAVAAPALLLMSWEQFGVL